MRALVTGGAGFIGQHLVRRLVQEGKAVSVLDARTYAATGWDAVSQIATMFLGDVTRYEAVQDAVLASRPAVVYHLAAESHVDRSLLQPGLAMHVNAVGTQVVASVCAKAKIPLVYCSTDEVYGDVRDAPQETGFGAMEFWPLNPSSPYSAGKAAGEMAVFATVRSFGLVASITRACNAFGPGQYPEKLVPIACRMLDRGEPVPLHGGGSQVRQWIHVEELADGLVRAGRDASRRGVGCEVYNLAGPRVGANAGLTVRKLVKRIAAALGVPEERAWVAVGDRPGQDQLYRIDGSKAWRDLGFEAQRRITDEAEIRALVAAYSDSDTVHLASW